MTHWPAGYLGIPYLEKGRSAAGCDCWGLVRLVLERERAIALPSYTEAYASLEERQEIAALLSADSARWPWRPVLDPREFDVALFRRGRHASHVGIVAGAGRMLHVTGGIDTRIEAYDGPRWRDRLLGFYRHAEIDK